MRPGWNQLRSGFPQALSCVKWAEISGYRFTPQKWVETPI
jgi:hypothetical protein